MSQFDYEKLTRYDYSKVSRDTLETVAKYLADEGGDVLAIITRLKQEATRSRADIDTQVCNYLRNVLDQDYSLPLNFDLTASTFLRKLIHVSRTAK